MGTNGGNLARILTDGSDKALVDAIEQNCIDFFMEYGRGPGSEIHREGGVTWFTTGIPHPLFNGVMTAQLAPEDVDRRIDDLVREFRDRNLPLEWTVGSSTIPQELGRRLEEKGFRNVLRVPGMAVPLHRVAKNPLPDGLTIEPTSGHGDFETAMRIALATFEIPTEFASRLAYLEESMPPDHPDRTWMFLGRLRDTPVASSMLFLAGGVVGVYFVGTLPEARRLGIARAMTTAVLQEGQRRGYRFGVLQATSMGIPVYRRMGFRTYSDFAIYS